jgi:hypothetical protein
MRFREWLILQERQLFPPDLLQSWEYGFRQGLEQLIQSTRDPVLKAEFERMRNCPIRDQHGQCRSFVDYIIGALIRNGIPQMCDPEEAMAYIFSNLLTDRTLKGTPKLNLFGGFDESRPYNRGDNPFEARFKVSVANLIRTIASGKVAQLRQRQPGTLSIGGGGRNERGFVSPDEIPGRPASSEQEMFADIVSLLQRQQQLHPDLPLVALFGSILSGEGTRVQRAKFGHKTADEGRRVIVNTLWQYARSAENWQLLRLLQRIQADATMPRQAHPQPKPAPAPKPKLPPDEQDYRSIVDVMERSGRQATMAILGKLRRRWLERPPRDPSSPHRNRLADVLARMVSDGILTQTTTRWGGALYVPGPRYQEYLTARQVA